jgi:RNA polymerase sigma-70 factor (ECF subfamily)
MGTDAEAALVAVMRDEWPRLIAASMKIVGDLQTAEDVVSDTLLTALDRWPLDGVPDRPGGWLTTACRRRALNAARDRRREADRTKTLAAQARTQDEPVLLADERCIVDDRLALMAMCCHPVLPLDARVALTLRMVAGLSTDQIAAAFHEPPATTGQRLLRAKKTLRANRVAFTTDDIDLPVRLPAILDVLGLLFAEGHLAHNSDTLTRTDVAAESYRLTTLLTVLAPDDCGPWALHALQSFHLSRWDTRVDETGQLLTLDQQDRTRWDHELIRQGTASLRRARRLAREPTRLLIEAELAESHAAATKFEDTDWPRIVKLYEALMNIEPTPVIELNRAVAVAMRDGPAAALPILDRLAEDPALARSHRVWAVRADMHGRLNHVCLAADDYRRALDLVTNESERAYLMQARERLSTTKG